jgi:hypothetical protein
MMGKTAYEKTLKCRNNILTGINKEGEVTTSRPKNHAQKSAHFRKQDSFFKYVKKD